MHNIALCTLPLTILVLLIFGKPHLNDLERKGVKELMYLALVYLLTENSLKITQYVHNLFLNISQSTPTSTFKVIY